MTARAACRSATRRAIGPWIPVNCVPIVQQDAGGVGPHDYGSRGALSGAPQPNLHLLLRAGSHELLLRLYVPFFELKFSLARH